MNRKRFIYVEFTMSTESNECGWNMPHAHLHNDYEVYLLTSGSRIMSIDEAEYPVSAGDAVLLPSNVPHRSTGNMGYQGICIHFSEKYLKKYYTEEVVSMLLSCFQHPILQLSKEACRFFEDKVKSFEVAKTSNFLLLGELLEQLCHCATTLHTTSMLPQTSTQLSKAKQIEAYLTSHYAEIQNISQIAEFFDVTESYIFRIFREWHQTTPKKYINQLRLDCACHLLENSLLSIKNIASNLGYENCEYFHRLFKQAKGCTPCEYRNQRTKH